MASAPSPRSLLRPSRRRASSVLVEPLKIVTARKPRGARGAAESAWSEEHAGVEFKFKQGEPVLLCKRYMPKTEHTTGPSCLARAPRSGTRLSSAAFSYV